MLLSLGKAKVINFLSTPQNSSSPPWPPPSPTPELIFSSITSALRDTKLYENSYPEITVDKNKYIGMYNLNAHKTLMIQYVSKSRSKVQLFLGSKFANNPVFYSKGVFTMTVSSCHMPTLDRRIKQCVSNIQYLLTTIDIIEQSYKNTIIKPEQLNEAVMILYRCKGITLQEISMVFAEWKKLKEDSLVLLTNHSVFHLLQSCTMVQRYRLRLGQAVSRHANMNKALGLITAKCCTQ